MSTSGKSRRQFLKAVGVGSGAMMLWPKAAPVQSELLTRQNEILSTPNEAASADCTLHICTSPIEIAPKQIISITTYNGQFPGPLLRFKEGREVMIDVYNDTDTPEQLHW